jgi:hypothetical protein
MGGMEKLRHCESRWSFAGTTDGEISQANNRHAGFPPSRSHAQCRRGAVKSSQRG